MRTEKEIIKVLKTYENLRKETKNYHAIEMCDYYSFILRWVLNKK